MSASGAGKPAKREAIASPAKIRQNPRPGLAPWAWQLQLEHLTESFSRVLNHRDRNKCARKISAQGKNLC
jgi:hypothetical protein